jgi:hypothetical protein
VKRIAAWFFGLLKKRKSVVTGIGMDEPIEVSPDKFVTAREMTMNAVSPEEFDERMHAEARENPELAKLLEKNFGWKPGDFV